MKNNMAFNILILPQAKIELLDCRTYYNNHVPGLGKRFIKSVKNSIVLISKHPELFATRYNNTRTAPVRNFPFLIHYTTDLSNKIITILAVKHTAQNPDSWPK